MWLVTFCGYLIRLIMYLVTLYGWLHYVVGHFLWSLKQTDNVSVYTLWMITFYASTKVIFKSK